jgi:hypothetical protein
MARGLPRLDLKLAADIDRAVGLAQAGELVRSAVFANPVVKRELHPARLEYLYEVAYLQVFIRWELFLETTFLRCICGQVSRLATPVMQVGVTKFATLASANAAVMGSSDYLLWHNPSTVVNRVRRYLKGSTHETVILSNKARLEHLASIRHRVVHGQDDARKKFDAATMALAGQRYRGSRPGRFLRDWNHTVTPQARWLDVLSAELKGLANQIV